MKSIDLNKIITDQDLDRINLAKELYPKNKHPMPALERVLRGEAFLDTNQLSKLSTITGIPIGKLFEGSDWVVKSQPDKILFSNENFTAEIDTVRWVSKIYHKETLFHENVIIKSTIPISEYIQEINDLITKYNKNEPSRN